MDYEQLLAKAFEKLPENRGTGERFEMPVADTLLQGSGTIFKNFVQIAEKLRREPKHMMKYLTKELATPAVLDGPRAIFQSKLQLKVLQLKLEAYVKEFVICKECKRPDTQLVKEERIMIMKCEACGAKSAVKNI